MSDCASHGVAPDSPRLCTVPVDKPVRSRRSSELRHEGMEQIAPKSSNAWARGDVTLADRCDAPFRRHLKERDQQHHEQERALP